MQVTAKTVGLLAIEALSVVLLWPGSFDVGSALSAIASTVGASPALLDAALIAVSVAAYLEILKVPAEAEPSPPLLHAQPSRGAK